MRIRKLGWAIVGSMVLHAGLLGIFWPKTPTRVAASNSIVIHAELIAFDRPIEAAANTEAPRPPPTQQASVPAPVQAPLPVISEVRARVPLPTAPDIPTNIDTTGYLPIDAVDQPALPVGDWVIDTEALPRGYTLRLVLQLWISASGAIDRWDLIGETNPVLAQKALAHLDNTVVQPALLNQIAVPSTRQLEVVVTRD